MGVRSRIIAGICLLTGVVVVVSTLVTYLIGNRVLDVRVRENIRREVLRELEGIESTVKDAETGQRGFIITGDDRFLKPYHDALEHLPAVLEKFRGMPRLDITADDEERVIKLIQSKLEEVGRTVELRKSGGFDAAAAVVASGQGHIMEELRTEIERIRAKKMAALDADARDAQHATHVRTLVFALTGLLNVGFLIWAYRRVVEAMGERDYALDQAQARGRELQQQKDLLSVTLSSIGDCVMVTDREGRITFMNPVAEKLTGWSSKEAVGRPTPEVFRILNEFSRAPVESPVEKVIKHGVIVGLANHTVLVRKDGTEVPIDDSGAPIRDEKGEIRGVVLIFRDFSEHKRVEGELREATQIAETANKAKDQFLAMLSHELRTPLTPVLATLNLWEASEDVPEHLQSDVQMLRRSIELEARIIDDLLDLTRIARGLLSFSPENTDVHSLIEFQVGLSQSEFLNKDLKISLNLNAVRHHVYTDAARLQQVIWNILRNAIKFTDNGGRVTISTANDADGNVVINISDTGIGMTPDTISKLFVPFEQADPTRNRRYGGLGLGMAISNAIVDLLEGGLSAESEGLGRGSTFTVRLKTVDAVTESPEPDRMPAASRGKVKLLLVEDHVDTARALTRLLESRGYKMESVPTVTAGLEAIGREAFDLILCDLGLPDGTGIDLIEKVRKTLRTPAIALTGFGMQHDVDRAQNAGFDAHLTKPVNLQKLEATIWRLLQDGQ